MSHSPSSTATGVEGAIGTAGQTVATTAYSVGTAIRNRYGDRYAAICVKSTQVYTLYVYGYDQSFSSAGGSAPTNGKLLHTSSGNAASALDGTVHYVRTAGYEYILPVLYQSSGSNSTVTLTVDRTFND